MSIIGDLIKITNWPQRLMIGGLAAAALAATTYNVVQVIENRHLSSVNKKLNAAIEDPKTGYIVRLSQAQTNTATCTTAIGRQNKAITELATSRQAAVDDAARKYAVERRARLQAERDVGAFLAHEPKGDTVAERIADVDAQILEDLK